MLSDEELLIFHQSVDRVRRVAARSLGELADAGRAVDFVANLHRGLDQVAARAAELQTSGSRRKPGWHFRLEQRSFLLRFPDAGIPVG